MFGVFIFMSIHFLECDTCDRFLIEIEFSSDKTVSVVHLCSSFGSLVHVHKPKETHIFSYDV